EAQSDSTWYVDESMNNLSGGCRSKLIDEVQDKCLRTSHGSTVSSSLETLRHRIIRQPVGLGNVIPARSYPARSLRRAETCQDGKCVKKCDVRFVS
ncbi:unnamed protein product, partial [Ixodes pacificus]